jgi:hypothetical protein
VKPRSFRLRIALSATAGLLAVLAAQMPFDFAPLFLLPGAAIASPMLPVGEFAQLPLGEAGAPAYFGTLWIGSFLVWSGLCFWLLTTLSHTSDERASRTTNAVVGTTSAALIFAGLFALSFRLPINDSYWGSVGEWVHFASIIAGSILAGLLLLLFRKMKWYLAALAGTVLTFPLAVIFGNACAIIG